MRSFGVEWLRLAPVAVIEKYFSLRLVSPSWFGEFSDVHHFWGMAETWARLDAMAVVTLAVFLASRPSAPRPKWPVVLLPAALAAAIGTGLFAWWLVAGFAAHPIAALVRFSFLIGLGLFVFLAVMQFIALRVAHGRTSRLLAAYAAGLAIFAGGAALPLLLDDMAYGVVASLGLVFFGLFLLIPMWSCSARLRPPPIA
jgi:hypothetical protein